MVEQMERRCLVCGKFSGAGLNILKKHICWQCENELLTTGVSDPQYEKLVTRLREIWDDVLARERA